MEEVTRQDAKGTWQEDFASVVALLEDTQPCYVIYNKRAGETNDLLLVVYVPDQATVRDKMLYAVRPFYNMFIQLLW